MKRRLKQGVMIAIFGMPIVAITAFGVVMLVPIFGLFDWIDEDRVNWRNISHEALGPLTEFVDHVRGIP